METKSTRCKEHVKDSRTGRMRRCKNRTTTLYCSVHSPDKERDMEEDVGFCCFCGNECNPCSQSCGRCARNLSWYSVPF